MPSARPFFGWRVVATAFVLAIFGWGVGFYGPPIHLHAVVERTGWSVALASVAVTAHFLVGVVGGAISRASCLDAHCGQTIRFARLRPAWR